MSQNYVDEEGRFDSKRLLEDSFLKNLGGSIPIQQTRQEPITSKKIASEVVNYDTEKMLLDLYESRDSLIDAFSQIGLNKTSQMLISSINKIGNCIKGLGGDVEYFDPLANVSGLQSPKLNKSAERVIENTREAYNLGKIEDAKVEDDGKTIIITFIGKHENTNYKSVGTIVASDTWLGNEAIDYVYAPEAGRMSVKIPNALGHWVDKSNNYKISWELFESDVTSLTKKAENIEKTKKEIKNDTSNNGSDDDIGDFPIEEK